MGPTAEALAPYCYVYAIDLPGFGRSEKPRDALGIGRQSDVLRDWMEKTNVRKPILVGHSVGAQIVIDFASRYPSWALGVVLLGPTVDAARRTRRQQLALLVKDVFLEPFTIIPVGALDYARNGFRRFRQTFKDALDDPVERKVRLVDVPALVVRGARDPVVSRSWATKVAERLPQGRLVEIDDRAHATNFNAGETVAALIRTFAEEIRQPPGRRSLQHDARPISEHDPI